MKHALDARKGIVIPATNANRAGFYRCPICLGAADLRAGRINTAHFAHQKYTAPEDCENYHPSFGRSGTNWGVRRGARHLVHINPLTRSWDLIIELDEIPVDESLMTAVSLLRFEGIEVRHNGVHHESLEIDRLSPGSTRNVVRIGPSRHHTEFRTIGRWPSTVRRDRWNVVLPGIPETGALFAQYRGGAFHRHDPWVPLHWGQRLVLIGSKTAEPPRQLDARRLESIHSDGTLWSAWLVTLPQQESRHATKWLSRFAALLETAYSRTRLLTPPIEYDTNGPCYHAGMPVVALPARDASVVAAESADNTVRGIEISKRSTSAQRLISVTVTRRGAVRLRTDRRGDALHYEVVPADRATIDRPDDPWALIADDTSLPVHGTYRSASTAAVYRITTRIPALTFSATVRTHTHARHALHNANAETTTAWLNEHAAHAHEFEVDAGNLGFVRVTAPERTLAREPRLRPSWMSAHVAATGRPVGAMPPHWPRTQR
ncbi:hypothetical protein [Prescottella sp. R16]|uniref:competence protein CoiA family protein n=1 Tax=Prescottella sp. R16 TaxID=3064529 RepID=UPI00272E18A2|nr:hypothetical protein [Prescottella sp. R16]